MLTPDLHKYIQLDAARIITGLRRGTSHAVLYNELAWIPLSKRRQITKLIHIFKILNHETPNYINDIVNKYNTHETGYALRNENLRYPIPRTTLFNNLFFPSTIEYKNGKNDSILTTIKQYNSSPKYFFVDTASNLFVDTASQK